MKELRDKKIIKAILEEIRNKAKSFPSPVKIMEVCGTHTMTIHRYGLKKILEISSNGTPGNEEEIFIEYP